MKRFVFLFCFIFLFNTTLKAQEKKDTLFFKYDNKYIKTFAEMPNHFYLEDSSGGSHGTFFFGKGDVKSNLNPKSILSLKKYVRSSVFYDKTKKLNDEKIADFFSNYVVFFVKTIDKKVEYIQVKSSFEIE